MMANKEYINIAYAYSEKSECSILEDACVIVDKQGVTLSYGYSKLIDKEVSSEDFIKDYIVAYHGYGIRKYKEIPNLHKNDINMEYLNQEYAGILGDIHSLNKNLIRPEATAIFRYIDTASIIPNGLKDSTLFCTHVPALDNFGLIYHYGIKKIFYDSMRSEQEDDIMFDYLKDNGIEIAQV